MHYNTIFLNRIKISIINIPITNLIALGIFSQDTKSSIIRIFLLNMIISFLNYIGDKNDFFKSKHFNLNDIKPLKNINYNNFLYSKIYDTFLSIPIQIHFSHIIKKIFRRRALYIKDIHYKNYYIIDLSKNKIILSLETLHDKNNDKDPVFKTSNQTKIWDELLLHCHNLKNDYIKKNNMTFNGIDYQNFFVKIEYKATYPRRNFIIKFLPLLDGMCIIHEYIQLKISTFEGDEKKEYNEKKIIYGYDAYDNIFRNSDNRYFENEHYLLKQVHFFIIESLFCSNNSISYFFILNREPKIYFSKEILLIIDNEIKDYLKKNNNNIDFIYNGSNECINRIISALYEEYIQINNNEKMLHKSSNLIQKDRKNNDLILKEIESLNKNKSLQITKNETLVFLFNSIQYNKNINPNDITLDLNDERISQLRITHNNNDDFPSPRRSDLIDKNNRPNSIRLSELLAEKPSIVPSNRPSKETLKSKKSRDSKFPYDSENKNEIEIENLYNEYNDEDNYNNENSKRYSNNNIINTSSNYKNNIITDEFIDKGDNINNEYDNSYVNNNENINYNNNIDNGNDYSNNNNNEISIDNNNIIDNYKVSEFNINENEDINNKENDNINNSINKNNNINNNNVNNNNEIIYDIQDNNNTDNFDNINNNQNIIDNIDTINNNDNDKFSNNNRNIDNENYSNYSNNKNNSSYNIEEIFDNNDDYSEDNNVNINNPSLHFSSTKNLKKKHDIDKDKDKDKNDNSE